jgi:hypothetical protein
MVVCSAYIITNMKNILKTLVLFFTFTFLFSALISNVNAHILKTDGSIGIVLHVNPNDEPKASVESNIYIEITDKNKKFDITKCDCKIRILLDDKEILSDTLSQENQNIDLNSPVFKFIFPQIGIYQIRLIGAATNNEDFQKFNINYDIRVAEIGTADEVKDPSDKGLKHYIIHYGEILVVIVIFIMLVIVGQYQKRKQSIKTK